MADLRLLSDPKDALPSASPERTALAAAIAEEEARQAEEIALRDAQATSLAAVIAARKAVQAATDALDAAKQQAAESLLNAPSGEQRPSPVAAARARLTDTEDGLEAALAARATVEERAQAAARGRPFAGDRVRRAAMAVIRAEGKDYAAVVAAEVAELQAKLAARGATLDWLVEAGIFPTDSTPGPGANRVLDRTIETTLFRLGSPPNSWRGIAVDASEWEAALTALMADATALLPTAR